MITAAGLLFLALLAGAVIGLVCVGLGVLLADRYAYVPRHPTSQKEDTVRIPTVEIGASS